jgi:hypothetical protein
MWLSALPRFNAIQPTLTSVPPEDLDEYFKNLSSLICAGATGLLNAKIDSRARRLSPVTWLHELNQLEAAAARHHMVLDWLNSEGSLLRLSLDGWGTIRSSSLLDERNASRLSAVVQHGPSS